MPCSVVVGPHNLTYTADEKPVPQKINPPAAISYPLTLEEAKQRLINAGPAVDHALANNLPLPASAYSLVEKQKVIAEGIQDRYLVRLIETSYAGPEGFISRKQDYGTLFFTAPLSMVEHGDTNAKALLNAFGTRHDPQKQYSILIIDKLKMEEVGDVQTVIPTFSNLENLIDKNPVLTKVPAADRNQVLKEEFKDKYYKFAKTLASSGVNQKVEKEVIELAISQGHSVEQAKLLIARHKLANDLSIWEEFTGNGMTLDISVSGPL